MKSLLHTLTAPLAVVFVSSRKLKHVDGRLSEPSLSFSEIANDGARNDGADIPMLNGMSLRKTFRHF